MPIVVFIITFVLLRAYQYFILAGKRMLRVDSNKSCKLVYAICKHDFLGYLIEPHIVQLNPQGDFSLTYQRLFSTTAKEFAKHLTDADFKIIKILDELEQDHIIKKNHKKNIRALEFFSKIFDEKLYNTIRPKIEKRMAEVLELLKHRDIYLMGKEGWPVERKLEMAPEPASVLFHFRRNETETRYFPTIKYQGLRIEFMFCDAQIICNQPAWMLLNGVLHYFEDDMEGKKLQPFLNKRYIAIPRATEKAYFEKFVSPLIEKHHVYAEGFEIKTETHQATPLLKVIYVPDGVSQLQLNFRYGDHIFPMGNNIKVSVRTEKTGDSYVFHRIKRSLTWENNKLDELKALGISHTNSLFNYLEVNQTDDITSTSYSVIDWVNEHLEILEAAGFEIQQADGGKQFLFATSRINLEVRENNDWFDIYAIVYFGAYQIPFIELKNHILHKIKEFVLPGGEIAIIPEKWFSQYGNMFSFTDSGKELRLKKHHIGLINELAKDSLASVTIDRKLQKLSEFEGIDDKPMPIYFKGTLRPYQKAGYNWFNFLKQYNFGGCLADDMGLGKTIQTLAFLQQLKEEDEQANTKSTSLIIMPTSLIYNWLNEAKKFSPKLKFLTHIGTLRNKDIADFANYDVVITTYGITRIDESILKGFYFNYIILDESQNIKNPSSKAFRAVRSLKSKHRLILSGTPVENSVNDLWSQLTFLNPGLLGTHAYFNEEFVTAIEKKKEEDKAERLQALIKPFILRRTKEQVATELPPKTEQIFYCKMSEEQANVYEKVRSEYRNELLLGLESGTFAKKQLQVLQGLTTLRQLANHPVMVDPDYAFDSGKFENVIHMLNNVLTGGHKVLVFSQFVKHLDIFKKHFEKEKIKYLYLDGATRNRGDIVDEFQGNDDIRLFLISIKAGGVGLNLTEADYVFILDPWWNPAVEQQAVDRTHRIGQKKNVFIYKFITKDSVEEKILALQKRKKRLASSLITTEDSFFKSLTKEDIADILR